MATFSITTQPQSEPLTRDEVKIHLGINGDDFDGRLDQLIAAARKTTERMTNRRLIEQDLAVYFDWFPRARYITLPVAPVSAVGSVQYYDADGVLQTFAGASYHTDLISEPGRIVLVDGEVWPDTEIARPNAVVVNLTAGYGDSAADIDEGIITAMLMMIEKAFDRPDKNYLDAIDRVLKNELSPYSLRRFR